MGLLDILNGMQNGPRGQTKPAPAGSGGMSPIAMALLGLVAYKAIKQLSPDQPNAVPATSRSIGRTPCRRCRRQRAEWWSERPAQAISAGWSERRRSILDRHGSEQIDFAQHSVEGISCLNWSTSSHRTATFRPSARRHA